MQQVFQDIDRRNYSTSFRPTLPNYTLMVAWLTWLKLKATKPKSGTRREELELLYSASSTLSLNTHLSLWGSFCCCYKWILELLVLKWKDTNLSVRNCVISSKADLPPSKVEFSRRLTERQRSILAPYSRLPIALLIACSNDKALPVVVVCNKFNFGMSQLGNDKLSLNFLQV